MRFAFSNTTAKMKATIAARRAAKLAPTQRLEPAAPMQVNADA